MSGIGLKIEVDTGGLLNRTFTALEQQQLPFAMMNAVNLTAAELQKRWQQKMLTVFDHPTRLTLNAVGMVKSRYSRNDDGTKSYNAAIVFIKDRVSKGTAPAKYLLPEVDGGGRGFKGLERALQRGGWMAASDFAVPADVEGNPLIDGYGNVKAGVVQQIIAQLKSGYGNEDRMGYISNETDTSKKRNAKRGTRKNNLAKKNRRFFLGGRGTNRGDGRSMHLSPGIYLRDGKHDLVKVFNITSRSPRYQPRYDIFGYAQQAWNDVMPYFFERALQSAIDNARGNA